MKTQPKFTEANKYRFVTRSVLLNSNPNDTLLLYRVNGYKNLSIYSTVLYQKTVSYGNF